MAIGFRVASRNASICAHRLPTVRILVKSQIKATRKYRVDVKRNVRRAVMGKKTIRPAISFRAPTATGPRRAVIVVETVVNALGVRITDFEGAAQDNTL